MFSVPKDSRCFLSFLPLNYIINKYLAIKKITKKLAKFDLITRAKSICCWTKFSLFKTFLTLHCWKKSFYLQCMATGASSAAVHFWVHPAKGRAMRISAPWGPAPIMSSWRLALATAKTGAMLPQPSLLGLLSSFSFWASPFLFLIQDYYDAGIGL